MRAMVLSVVACGSLLLLSGSGCAPRSALHKPGAGADTTSYRFEEEGRIPPLKAGEMRTEPDVEELPVGGEEIQVEEIPFEEAVEEPDTAGSPGAGDSRMRVEGFRVQLLAVEERQAALKFAKEVENRIDLAVYVTFEEGLYKVRVGDFTSREEAQGELERLRGAGFADAWIVKCEVTAPRR